MNERKILHKLYNEKLLPEETYRKIDQHLSNRLFSLHWEIKTILYLGVLLLSTGIGMLVYENIDMIGHAALIAAVGGASAGCFYYCWRKRPGFFTGYVESPGTLFDYILLLGCLLFLAFEGYLQYQYNIFGELYGLSVIIPCILFFLTAYYFDHKGVLSLAITGLAGWMGISVTPKDLLSGSNDFTEEIYIWTGLGFGLCIVSLALTLDRKNIKKHFTFTYLNFGAHALFISTLSGMFFTSFSLLFTVILFLFTAAFIYYAKREKSLYFLLISVLYAYVGLTWLIFMGIDKISPYGDGVIYMGIFYFIFSCGAIIYFFVNYKKLLKL